uniref:SWIM-type domain-containing protein n=1 Tax=Ditylenchus dipsaci TaxID=166011 RepID=A0A915EF88_9BILA
MEALPTRRGEQNSYFEVAAFEGDDAMAKVQQWKEDFNSEWNKDGNKWQLKKKTQSQKHDIENFECNYARRKSFNCPAVLRIRRIGENKSSLWKEPEAILITSLLVEQLATPKKIQNEILVNRLGENLLDTFEALHSSPSYTSWELYKKNRSAIHILNHSNGWPNFYCCTCPVGIKKSPCKHSVMLMKIKGILSYPRDATAEPLLQKKKRGRPSN